MNKYAEFTRIDTTLNTINIMTPAQRGAVARLCNHDNADYLTLHAGVFGLPDGYLGFVLHYRNTDHQLVGGISPQGDIST